MRRSRVIRFLAGAFAAGAFIGLVCGLTLGGDPRASQAQTRSEPDNPAANPAVTQPQAQIQGPMTAELARAIGANEMGKVLVIMYHHIGAPESQYTRTPENFRRDLALLKSKGFHPVNARDLASGNIDIPAGRSPVVITFDDSSPGQYRIRDDGSIDPDSAVGIMEEATAAGGWASRASFYCLLDVTPKDRILFGQPEKQREKLRNLVNLGYEVGSHTVTHLNLRKASAAEATKQLALSQERLEDMIGGGYAVVTIAVPYGEYPEDLSLLKSGEYEGVTYSYIAALSVNPVPSPSPFSTTFDPWRIPRIPGSANYILDAITKFEARPELRYVSDGDPATVSAPADLSPELGEMRNDLGRPVVRY